VSPPAPPSIARIVAAGAVAAAISGVPSTIWALLTGGDPLAAARAAGTLVPGRRARPGLVAGAVAHVAVSTVWTAALGLTAQRVRVGAISGAAVGLGIAVLDLEVVGRRYPAIAVLPRPPQWADHVAFGALLGTMLRPRRPLGPPPIRSPHEGFPGGTDPC